MPNLVGSAHALAALYAVLALFRANIRVEE